MRRATVAILLAVIASHAAPALARPSPEEIERRTDTLAAELRCPVCQQLSVKDSPSRVSLAFRERIRELVAQGRSDQEVRDFFVARYGEWILLSPPKRGIALWVWLTPVMLLAAGLMTVLVAVRRWTRRAQRLAGVAASRPDAVARARATLARLDDAEAGR